MQRKAHVEASVRASGVTAAGADRVEVLLFVNQTTTSTANSGEPQTALNRVIFSMVRQGDTWRVDDITSSDAGHTAADRAPVAGLWSLTRGRGAFMLLARHGYACSVVPCGRLG